MFSSTKKNALIYLTMALLLVAFVPFQVTAKELIDMSIEDLLGLDFSDKTQEGITIYGYMSTNVEKVFSELSVDENGQTVRTTSPHEWSLPHFNLFLRAPIGNKISTFVNIASEDLEVRNMWGNFEIDPRFQVQFGKIYREFDLFNSKLDEVPTYLGIEPPELFDSDHLLIPRLTTFVVHGTFTSGKNSYSYNFSTDNGENGPSDGVFPLGWDFRANLNNKAIVGVSGYFSSIGNGKVSSDKAVGEGSPDGGVLPWMASDDYRVYGAFTELQFDKFLIKAAFYQSDHNAVRDPDAVLTVLNEAGLNNRQIERFIGPNILITDATAADVILNADYSVQTGYFRVGYFFDSKYGTIAPFAFFDWMDHPEVIASKTYGGDNESGISDNGNFTKYTAGVSYKPVDQVAIKLDSSLHVQKFNSKTESYPEVRFDISYLFK